MQQYIETKKQYPDCILFYRLGDFYEMFFDDALTVSKELEITLTGKSCGLEERAPMCGVPYHAVDVYLNRLVKKGYKVAICEQMEDPKQAKGIVRRDVIRVVTPGTTISTEALDESKNNYLMSVVCIGDTYGISVVDITTGDYYVTEVNDLHTLMDEINKFQPSEMICNQAFCANEAEIKEMRERYKITVSCLESRYFNEETCVHSLKEHFHIASLNGLGLEAYHCGIIAAGSLLLYLLETQKNSLLHLTTLIPYSTSRYMILDTSTRRNLELTETLREKQKRGSLLWVLDKTKTAMGARTLRNYMEQPLISKTEIERRQDAIEELNQNLITREEIREYLHSIYDLERLIGRISYKTANPRDFIAFQTSLEMIPHIKYLLAGFQSELLKELWEQMDSLEDICTLIKNSIAEEPPIVIREGGIIKNGYHEEVDKLRQAKTEGKNWIADLEVKERERTGIKNLKIKYNRVFGYYLEVTNSFQNLVPENYTRKQTLSNAERYITPELKELEDMILGAEDRLISLEYDLFCEIREKIANEVLRIQTTAKAVAQVDVFASLAYVAEHNQFVRPTINEEGVIRIKNGRHPVVEQMIPNDMFVANDTFLDNQSNRIAIITGPNMAGKSTYMRQTALIVLLAQIGSFVPAVEAEISICDRIFTRVGASDDLASGQSTFMVEMTEVANILRNATARSLIVLDEIGRGTSTFDGLSIAWAVVEYIGDTKILGAKTLFATHYHELTELEGKLNGVNNYCIAVKEQGDDIVFLRKIIKGGADKSYGIQVAKLAGVPDLVIERAKELVEELSDADIAERAKGIAVQKADENKNMENTVVQKNKNGKKKQNLSNELELGQMSLFDTMTDNTIIQELASIDLGNITPIEALNRLYQLQSKVKNRW